MAKRDYPNWVTPERQSELISLFSIYGNRCLRGHLVCPDWTHYISLKSRTVYVSKPKHIPVKDKKTDLIAKDENGLPIYLTVYKDVKTSELEAIPLRLYDVVSQEVINEYKGIDKDLLRLERKALHSLNEPNQYTAGEFNAIGRDIFYGNQPVYYIESVGVSAQTFHRLYKVRIASSYTRLFVDIDISKIELVNKHSKNARHKLTRYGKRPHRQTERDIEHLVFQAVRHYFSN